jgi:hypothetical protein
MVLSFLFLGVIDRSAQTNAPHNRAARILGCSGPLGLEFPRALVADKGPEMARLAAMRTARKTAAN